MAKPLKKSSFRKTFKERGDLRFLIYLTTFVMFLFCLTCNIGFILGGLSGVIVIAIPFIADYFSDNPKSWETEDEKEKKL